MIIKGVVADVAGPGVVVVVVVVVPGVIGCGGGVVVWFIICICNPLCSLFILCLVIFNYIKYRHFEKKMHKR